MKIIIRGSCDHGVDLKESVSAGQQWLADGNVTVRGRIVTDLDRWGCFRWSEPVYEDRMKVVFLDRLVV